MSIFNFYKNEFIGLIFLMRRHPYNILHTSERVLKITPRFVILSIYLKLTPIMNYFEKKLRVRTTHPYISLSLPRKEIEISPFDSSSSSYSNTTPIINNIGTNGRLSGEAAVGTNFSCSLQKFVEFCTY